MVPWLSGFICLSAQLKESERWGETTMQPRWTLGVPPPSGTSGLRETWTGGSSGWAAGGLSSRAQSPAATVSLGGCWDPNFLPGVTTPLLCPT